MVYMGKEARMNEMIKSPMPIPENVGITVFLAGPMKGAPKWHWRCYLPESLSLPAMGKLEEAGGLGG